MFIDSAPKRNVFKSLKSQYKWSLWVFVAVHMAVAWSIVTLGLFNFEVINSVWERLIQRNGAIGALFPVIGLILDGFISGRWKEILVFWKHKDSLPGHRAFTKLGPDDSRIDLSALEAMHGPLPVKPKDQNRLWYQIYKKHTSNTLILEAHKKYLMARDVTTISFMLIFIGIGIVCWFGIWNKVGAWYISFLVVEYLVLAVTAQNNGKRLVCNVLAEESGQPKRTGTER